MKVIVRGPLLSKSGYGEHTRQVFQWALSRGYEVRCQVLNWGVTPWFLDRDDLNGLVGKIMERSMPFDFEADLSLQIQLPNEWDTSIAKINVGITAGVETDVCSQEWQEACNKMNLVIVPSTFTKNTLMAGGKVTTPVVVVPEAYSVAIDEEIERLEIPEVTTKFNFLLFGQVTANDFESDRKNLFYTVKWFCEEFAGNKEVGLVVKSNMGTNCVFHRHILKNNFSKLISEVRKGEYPKIYLLNGDMSQKEVASLMHSEKIHSMISFTRGEGYGLPLVDAAASGLPIIATNWSGHLEFLSKGHFSKVEYDLVNVPDSRIDEKIFIKGARWAMPRESDAKKRLRKTYESYSKPKEWATELKVKIKKDFCLEAVLNKYDEVLSGLV